MSTQIAKINLDSPTNIIPAYLQGNYTSVYENIGSGFSRNRISLKGNRFRLIVDNQEESIVETSYLDIIIVGLPKDVSRMYYGGAYNPDVKTSPVCFSTDGKTPNLDVKAKQADKCALCPQNEKGSRVSTDGIKFKACQAFRRLAVVLPNHLDRVFQLDCKATTLWSDSRASEAKFNLTDYLAKLKTRTVDPAWMITRLSFDTNESYAKLFFSPAIYVPQNMLSAVMDLTNSDEVKNILEITAATVDYSAEVDKPEQVISAVVVAPKTVVKPATPKIEVVRAPSISPSVVQTVPKPKPAAEEDFAALLAELGVPDDTE